MASQAQPMKDFMQASPRSPGASPVFEDASPGAKSSSLKTATARYGSPLQPPPPLPRHTSTGNQGDQKEPRRTAHTGVETEAESSRRRSLRDARRPAVAFTEPRIVGGSDAHLKDRFQTTSRRRQRYYDGEDDEDNHAPYTNRFFGISNPVIPFDHRSQYASASYARERPRESDYHPYMGPPAAASPWPAAAPSFYNSPMPVVHAPVPPYYRQPPPLPSPYPDNFLPPVRSYFSGGNYNSGGPEAAPVPPHATEPPRTSSGPSRPHTSSRRDRGKAREDAEVPKADAESDHADRRRADEKSRSDLQWEVLEAERNTRQKMEEEAIRWQEFRDADVRREREAMKRARIILKYEQELAERQQHEEHMSRIAFQEAIMAEVKSQTQELMRQKEEELRVAKETIQRLEKASHETKVSTPEKEAQKPTGDESRSSTPEQVWRPQVKARRAARRAAREKPHVPDPPPSREPDPNHPFIGSSSCGPTAEGLANAEDEAGQGLGQDPAQTHRDDNDDVSRFFLNQTSSKGSRHSSSHLRAASSVASRRPLQDHRNHFLRDPRQSAQDIATELVDQIMHSIAAGVDERFQYYAEGHQATPLSDRGYEADEHGDSPMGSPFLDAFRYRVKDEESNDSDEDQLREAIEAPPIRDFFVWDQDYFQAAFPVSNGQRKGDRRALFQDMDDSRSPPRRLRLGEQQKATKLLAARHEDATLQKETRDGRFPRVQQEEGHSDEEDYVPEAPPAIAARGRDPEPPPSPRMNAPRPHDRSQPTAEESRPPMQGVDQSLSDLGVKGTSESRANTVEQKKDRPGSLSGTTISNNVDENPTEEPENKAHTPANAAVEGPQGARSSFWGRLLWGF